MKKQNIPVKGYHCVQCHTEFIYKMELEDRQIAVCVNPKCPNYALLAIAQEKMPSEKEIEEAKKEWED